MYHEYFGLKGPPFAPAGAPATLFLSAGHREAMAALQWGLREPSGFTMLVGEVGSGKTTLVGAMLEGGCEGVRIAFVTNPTLSFEEILRLIAGQLGFKPERICKLELIAGLDSFIGALVPRESVALIFDEAQDLSDQTLEELRLLSNSQTAVQKRLQIVLVGQLELARRLERPELRQLNQRIGARALLPTLRREEVVQYVEYRLRAQGGGVRRLFKRGALTELARLGGGIPRRINMLCHNALMLAYAQQARRVSAAHVREAANDYDHLLANCAEGARNRPGRGALPKAAAALSIGLAAVGLSYLFASGALANIEKAVRLKVATLRLSENQPVVKAAEPTAHKQDGFKSSPNNSTADPAPDASDAAQQAIPGAAAAQQTSALNIQTQPPAAITASDEPAARTVSAPPPAIPAPPVVVVKAGDTLSKIALRHNDGAAPGELRQRLSMLMRSNPEITNPDHIYPGQIIRLQEASMVNVEGVPK
jgi:general secretion pathway protein A